jgi:hypothetical protein
LLKLKTFLLLGLTLCAKKKSRVYGSGFMLKSAYGGRSGKENNLYIYNAPIWVVLTFLLYFVTD